MRHRLKFVWIIILFLSTIIHWGFYTTLICWNHWPATTIEGWRVPKEYILLSTGLGDSADPGKWTKWCFMACHVASTNDMRKKAWRPCEKPHTNSRKNAFFFLNGTCWNSGPNLQALENHSNLHTVALEIHEQTMDRFVPINLSMLKAPKKTVLHGHSDLCRLWATAKVMEELGGIRICGWLAGSNAMAFQQSSTFLLDPSRAHAPPRANGSNGTTPPGHFDCSALRWSYTGRFDEPPGGFGPRNALNLGFGTSVYLSDIGWHGQSWAYPRMAALERWIWMDLGNFGFGHAPLWTRFAFRNSSGNTQILSSSNCLLTRGLAESPIVFNMTCPNYLGPKNIKIPGLIMFLPNFHQLNSWEATPIFFRPTVHHDDALGIARSSSDRPCGCGAEPSTLGVEANMGI